MRLQRRLAGPSHGSDARLASSAGGAQFAVATVNGRARQLAADAALYTVQRHDHEQRAMARL